MPQRKNPKKKLLFRANSGAHYQSGFLTLQAPSIRHLTLLESSFSPILCVLPPQQPFKSRCFYSVRTCLGKNSDFWGAVEESTNARWVKKSCLGMLNDVFRALVVLEMHSDNARSSWLGKTAFFLDFSVEVRIWSRFPVYMEPKNQKPSFEHICLLWYTYRFV